MARQSAPSAGAVRSTKSTTRPSRQFGLSPLPVQVTVTDADPGIPDEFRERVFEQFFRVEHHRSNDQDGVRGTGIGLYLCREIIKAHGGSIWCEPGVGGTGACLQFVLPRSS